MKKKLIITMMVTAVLAMWVLSGCGKSADNNTTNANGDVMISDEVSSETETPQDISIVENENVSITEDEDMNGAMGNAGYVDGDEPELPLDKDTVQDTLTEEEDMGGAMGNAGYVD